jgi:hypothetical protein
MAPYPIPAESSTQALSIRARSPDSSSFLFLSAGRVRNFGESGESRRYQREWAQGSLVERVRRLSGYDSRVPCEELPSQRRGRFLPWRLRCGKLSNKECVIFATSAVEVLVSRLRARMNALPPCRIVTIHAFRGDRTKGFRQRLFRALDEGRTGRGTGPPEIDCLLFAGHAGVSTPGDVVIWGFNPNRGTDPIWQLLNRLRTGGAYPGIVRDDTAVFTAAQGRGLTVLRFDVALSPPGYRTFRRKLTAERKQSRFTYFTYGFPDGDGDCNCTTWMERLGLPLLTGRMDEFAAVTGVTAQVRRRFGLCM